MFSATHFLKGLSCLNSPGTPQQLFAALRRQPNSTEKSVNATISCAEQRPFKTPQLPALRAVVSEPAQQKRRFFLLLYFQPVGSPSILEENVFQQASPAFAHGPDKARRQLFVGTRGCHPAPSPDTADHKGKQGLFSLHSGRWCSLCQRCRNSALGGTRISSLCHSALGLQKWARARARKKRLAANGKLNALLALPEGRRSPPGYYADSILEFLPERH